jgi:hypothetical protein
MPEIPLGTSSHNRRTTWNPEVRVLNMLVEQTATNQYDGVDHIQRPGLTKLMNIGPNPIQGIFRQAGTFGGDFLLAQGAELYRVAEGSDTATFIGDFDGTGRFTAAATATRAVMVTDGQAYRTDGVTLVDIVMPDDRPAGSVAQLNGYFIIPQEGSARFYWIEPGQDDPDGLSFATTESSPGNILKIERVGDELWFFKQEGIEVWTPTGDPDLPFQRTPGRNYDKGARSKDAICRFDNSVAWVGNDGIVYRGDNTPVRMSTNSIEEQIRKSSDYLAWSFAFDGHTCYCLTLTQGTWVYDVSSQQWSQFRSYGYDFWRAHVGDAGDRLVLCGDSETGNVYFLDAENNTDDGEPLEREVMGGLPVPRTPVRCDSICLYASAGTTPDPNEYPKVRISWSDDLETYGDFQDVSMGRQGQYGNGIRLNRLGMMRYPGRLWKFSATGDFVFTVHAAVYNEPL